MDSSSASTTNILDLNEECLCAVFKYLHVVDLCAVADVCTRLRNSAKTYYADSGPAGISFPIEYDVGELSMKLALLRASRLLRHFGEYIRSVYETYLRKRACVVVALWEQLPCNEDTRLKYQRKIIEQLIKYCSSSIIDLFVEGFALTSEITLMMRPLLVRIENLHFRSCTCDELLLRKLPLWSAELRHLGIFHMRAPKKFKTFVPPIYENNVLSFNGLRKPFQKLTSITFDEVDDIIDEDIEKILKYNPQLQKISLGRCPNLGANILKSIVQYVPGIELLYLELNIVESDDALEEDSEFEIVHDLGLWNGPGKISKYFGQLSKLKSLNLSLAPEIVADICAEIAAADIQLTYLWIGHLSVPGEKVDAFVEGIAKLTKLKQLSLHGVGGVNASHITCICKHQCALDTLDLFVDFAPTAEELLEWIECAERLSSLKYCTFLVFDEKCCIDANIFKHMLRVVEKRREKLQLNIHFDGGMFAANIPKDLSSAHKDVLTLDIPSNHISFKFSKFKVTRFHFYYLVICYCILAIVISKLMTLISESE